ncbi:hypothetical protein [Streptomyces sp. 7-21]|uniref:hypothetical protein n=1 Tax=Streptomyces sp. 7-21 TaxID=2802283 RepID=UPI0027DB4F37|nr:hypothetical protein [Streptomyces sp. 7-21]
MQSYETHRTQPPAYGTYEGGHQPGIPGMRAPSERMAGSSPTPIYDSLCAEYRRLFRALPGDRSDEEELRFRGFGGDRGYEQPGGMTPAVYPSYPSSTTYAPLGGYGGYPEQAAHTTAYGRAVPAALPPAQRDAGAPEMAMGG